MEHRRALKALDPNRNRNATPSALVKAKKAQKEASSNRASRAAKPRVAPAVERKQTAEEIKAKFDVVAQSRVSKDLTGLSEFGIQEWSVGDFEYIKTLGSGSSATVFCAKEKQSGYFVALKVQEADEDDGLAEAEIDIHESLDHHSIVKMIDYFYSDVPFGPPPKEPSDSPERFVCMILELCDGGSLDNVIRCADNGRLCEKQAAAYFWNAMSAMEHLHGEGIIMCDCKTANLLVSRNEVKLADFGMAVRDDDKAVVGGSLAYMAPEHLIAWREFNDNFDHRVDIYSLGVVLFEVLVGDLPYQIISDDRSSSNVSLLAAHLEKTTIGKTNSTLPVLDLRKLNDQATDESFDLPLLTIPDFVSGEARDLILRLMEPCPDKRISLSEAKRHSWLQKNQQHY